MFCTLVQGRGWQRLPEPQVSRDGEFRQRTRKKSVQIILPSGDALRFVLVSAERQNANWLPPPEESYVALLLTASAKGGRQ